MPKLNWACPVCSVPLPLKTLFVDSYFESLLKSVDSMPSNESICELEIHSDASWIIPPSELEQEEIIDLTVDYVSPISQSLQSNSGQESESLEQSMKQESEIEPGILSMADIMAPQEFEDLFFKPSFGSASFLPSLKTFTGINLNSSQEDFFNGSHRTVTMSAIENTLEPLPLQLSQQTSENNHESNFLKKNCECESKLWRTFIFIRPFLGFEYHHRFAWWNSFGSQWRTMIEQGGLSILHVFIYT